MVKNFNIGAMGEVAESLSTQLTLKEGPNTLRVVSPDLLEISSHWIDFVNEKKENITVRVICPESCPVCERQKSQKTWALLVWSYNAKGVKTWEFSSGLLKKLSNLTALPDYRSLLEYDLTIVREGTGMKTRYPNLVPGVKKELSSEIKTEVSRNTLSLREEFLPSSKEEIEAVLSKLPPVASSNSVDVKGEIGRFFSK